MLQRIYGTVFSRKEDLKEYLHNLEEAKKTRSSKTRKRIKHLYF
jgi:threonyl-tRNA synthetase